MVMYLQYFLKGAPKSAVSKDADEEGRTFIHVEDIGLNHANTAKEDVGHSEGTAESNSTAGIRICPKYVWATTIAFYFTQKCIF